MKTIKDIAKLAGVSVATVSKVINGYPDIGAETRQKVMEIIVQEDYQPNAIAKSLSGKQSHSIGLFINYNPTPGLHQAFFQGVISGLEKTLGLCGYDFVLFADLRWREQGNFLQKCRTRQVDGAVFMGINKEEPGLTEVLESDLPAVFIDGDQIGKRSVCVVWNNYSGVRQAIEHFYNLGHRKIGMIKGYPNIKPTIERTEGFYQALRQFSLTCLPEWIVGDDYLEASGYQGMRQLLRLSSRPTAVFCQSDSIAVGALKAIEEAGLKCPDDLSIIGYDDLDLCKYIKPRLTTVRQDTVLMGKTAAKALIRLINNPDSEPIKSMVLPVELVVRDSCRKLYI